MTGLLGSKPQYYLYPNTKLDNKKDDLLPDCGPSRTLGGKLTIVRLIFLLQLVLSINLCQFLNSSLGFNNLYLKIP